MPVQQRDIDRRADPPAQAAAGVDQLMGVGIADLAQKQAKGGKDQGAVQPLKMRGCANRPDPERQQQEMRGGQGQRQGAA